VRRKPRADRPADDITFITDDRAASLVTDQSEDSGASDRYSPAEQVERGEAQLLRPAQQRGPARRSGPAFGSM
jgi:hypothetical protein